MKKFRIFQSIVLLSILQNFIFNKAIAQKPKVSVAGVLDLSNYEFDESIKLNGEWIFAWNNFKNDFTFKNVNNVKYIKVPGSWTDYSHNSLFGKQVGYCTYGLKILLPKKSLTLSLYLPPIHSAYKLYIDKKLYAQAGNIFIDKSMRPEVKTQIVSFTPSKSEIIITIQVSNYHFISGGIWNSILLGTPEKIRNKREASLMLSSFLIGALLIMGLYHLGLFAIRKTDKGPLFFSIFCIFICVRESFSGEALFYNAFPSIDYEWSLKILYSSFVICLISFIFFIENLYSHYSILFKRVALVVCYLYLLMILFLPNTVYGGYLTIISLIAFVESIYWLVLVIKNVYLEPKNNVLILIGVLTLIICFINDILYEYGLVETYFLLPIGFFVFTLCQSILLALRFSNAFRQTESLSVELKTSNRAFQEMSIKQKETEARKTLEEMKNHFFSNITHEFRTPLTLIISPVERLLQGNTDPSLLDKSLKVIYRNASNLLLLINQLLDISKLESGSMKVVKYRGDVTDFVNELLSAFKLTAEEKNVKLEFNSSIIPKELIFDADKFEKICFNLLSNSLKFTPSGGFINIELSLENDNIIFKIKDTGLGISDDKVPYIFERFFQGNNSLTREFEGTGIGLALVKELVNLVNGKITVKSKLGEGTTFVVEFPVEEIRFDSDYSFPKPILIKPSFNITNSINANSDYIKTNVPLILIVEDNQDLLNYIIQDLSHIYNVLSASNGQEAWSICQCELPDLVISDIMMPYMNGYELCDKIKTTNTTNHIGVILLTAKAASESKIHGLALGANDYLSKPYHHDELKLRIKNFLDYQLLLRNLYSQQLSKIKSNEESIEENPFLTKIYSIVDKHLSNTEFTVAELASELAMSSRTLNRKLSTIIGLNANEIIRNYRLKKALEFLDSGLNISQTAYSVGFDNPSYFGQCFKELYNINPSEYLLK